MPVFILFQRKSLYTVNVRIEKDRLAPVTFRFFGLMVAKSGINFHLNMKKNWLQTYRV